MKRDEYTGLVEDIVGAVIVSVCIFGWMLLALA
jgi:hypothetical protein